MKAIVYKPGELPVYADFPDPVVTNSNELLMRVKAVAVKNLDRAKVSGKHYSSATDTGLRVAGSDGVGLLADGTRVYAFGKDGMLAEHAVVEKSHIVRVPEGLSDAIAAALPNAIMGSALALRYRAKMQAGDTVLINGATGFTGKMAVQLARDYGAKKVIVTGRNEKILQSLLQLGADEIVSLKQDDDSFVQALKRIHADTPIDVILDYVWGHSVELILSVLKGKGTFSHRTRLVTIGAMSGDTIQLSSQILRSVDLQISGSGLGSWSGEEVGKLFSEIIPEAFELAANNKLVVDTFEVDFVNSAKLWQGESPNGKRMVVVIP